MRGTKMNEDTIRGIPKMIKTTAKSKISPKRAPNQLFIQRKAECNNNLGKILLGYRMAEGVNSA